MPTPTRITPTLLQRLDYAAATLMAAHPPLWRHPHKALLFELACPPDLPPQGRIGYTRWSAASLPQAWSWSEPPIAIEGRPDFFDYKPAASQPAVEWHVNFADPNLFFGYGTGLFAQDEIQVAEHPALGALREALLAAGHPALTVEQDQPTPVLVTGVERRIHVATEPNPAAGRPHGLYGNAFAAASTEAVRNAATPIVPPTRSNILAIAAPRPGLGVYSREEILEAGTAAATAFAAARLESARLAGPDAAVVIHTGFWGCGAFGGNRVLMTLLQLLAAELVPVNRLVFHAGNPAGVAAFEESRALLAELRQNHPRPTLNAVLQWIDRQEFTWGVSDGN